MIINSKMVSRFLTLVFLFMTFCCLPVFAQNGSDSEIVKLPPPVQESFVESTGLMTPWFSSGCDPRLAYNVPDCRFILRRGPNGVGICDIQKYYDGVNLSKLSNCYDISIEELKGKDITRLYNNDGSLWYHFSNDFHSALYFGSTNEKPEFLPFGTDKPGNFFFGASILRIVSESPNWYEVEINEGTRATKFVWKKDSNWTKMTWDYWLGKVYILRQKSSLRAAPDGEIIKESANLKFDYYGYLNKTDGDWVFVKGVNRDRKYAKEYTGWIRWRSGRHILFLTSTRANEF